MECDSECWFIKEYKTSIEVTRKLTPVCGVYLFCLNVKMHPTWSLFTNIIIIMTNKFLTLFYFIKQMQFSFHYLLFPKLWGKDDVVQSVKFSPAMRLVCSSMCSRYFVFGNSRWVVLNHFASLHPGRILIITRSLMSNFRGRCSLANRL